MTDLEKRAKEYALDNYKNCLYYIFPYTNDSRAIEKAYLDATKAETALLSQHIIDLQKDKGNLTDKVRELEQQIEKMKSQYDYALNQLCESREIVCLMLSQYENKKEIDYSTKERGEKLLKQGVYKYD